MRYPLNVSLALSLLATLVVTASASGDEAATWHTDREATDSLDDWTVVTKHMFRRHGMVRDENQTILLGRGEPATGIRRKDNVLRDDYVITLDAKRIAGNDFLCGLTFPVADAYCTLIIGGWGGQLVGLSDLDGEPANENETATYVRFENGRWYSIRLQVTTDRVTAWIDEKELVNVERQGRTFAIWWEQEPLRPLGIATWNTSGAVRNFRQQSVDPQRTR